MKKRYKAFSRICINVRLKSGKYFHVAFDRHSDGTSTFITDNKDVIKGLESHEWFGKAFCLDAILEDVATTQEEATQEEVELVEIEVADYQEAKEYLAEKKGVSRTLMRNISAINEQAEKNGIKFKIAE